VVEKKERRRRREGRRRRRENKNGVVMEGVDLPAVFFHSTFGLYCGRVDEH